MFGKKLWDVGNCVWLGGVDWLSDQWLALCVEPLMIRAARNEKVERPPCWYGSLFGVLCRLINTDGDNFSVCN